MPQSPADDFGPLVEALTAVQARRHPLEERLRAIEERRNSTAPAVYEKVKHETLGKLAALDGEAASLRADAERAQRAVAEQASELTSALNRATESVEEIRFRNSLGEYQPDEFQRADAEAQAAVDETRSRLQALAELESLLGGFLGAAPSAPGPRSAEHSGPTSPDPDLIRHQPLPAEPTLPNPELESLFGAAPPPPPRLAGLPPPPPISGDAVRPAGPVSERDRTRTSQAFGLPSAAPKPKGHSEETTEDLRMPSSGISPPDGEPYTGPFRPTLIVKTKDKDRGEDTYELASGATLIGRAPENDVILLEESVSRRHARITVEGKEVSFEDLGSANGSFINNERMKPKAPQRLHDNDVIKLGQLLALFRIHPDD